MRVGLWLAAVIAAQSLVLANPAERRSELRKKLSGGVTVLFGRTEQEADDLRNGFFQEPNFYYLTGVKDPGGALMLLPAGTGTDIPGEILFLASRDPEREKWIGKMLDPAGTEARAATGFQSVMPLESLESELKKALERYPNIYTLTGTAEQKKLEALFPLRQILNAAPAIARLRMKKSPEELSLIQRSTDEGVKAHRAAWKRAAPGLYEYQIASTMQSVYFDDGCERNGYAPIVGSGPNSVFLHYSRNSRRMDRGELLLMDVGPECAGYVTDITRTIPVGARFSPRQREIYDIVLGAQKAAIAAVKPGMMLGKTAPNSLYKIAYDYINSHGKDRSGERLGKYFTHGLGHHVGLEVHDADDPTMPLEAGMVITIEPGIYIPEENIGIRIEDMVLVTDNGTKVLSGGLPREPDEIEEALGR
jgi:Xaa-Pro aminopeptidase